MRFIASGDLHVSSRYIQNRPRLPVSLQMLHDIVDLARLHRVKHVFWIGDVIDQKKGVPREVLVALYRFLKFVRDNYAVEIIFLRGNHETPDKGNVEESVIIVFEDLCEVIVHNEIRKIGDTVFYMLPWYPEAEFIKRANDFAKQAYHDTRSPKVLLAHVGLKEGKLGANIRSDQDHRRVSINHLHPELYDLALLGDYHRSQQVADNAWYVGAPMAHNFGDEDCVGPWLVDTDEGTMEPLVLPHRPPNFVQWRVDATEGLLLPGYRRDDYNRIHVVPALYDRVCAAFPEADVRISGKSEVSKISLVDSRLSMSDLHDDSKQIGRWLERIGASEKDRIRLVKIGLELIRDGERL